VAAMSQGRNISGEGRVLEKQAIAAASPQRPL